jgi:hypothetical protein
MESDRATTDAPPPAPKSGSKKRELFLYAVELNAQYDQAAIIVADDNANDGYVSAVTFAEEKLHLEPAKIDSSSVARLSHIPTKGQIVFHNIHYT